MLEITLAYNEKNDLVRILEAIKDSCDSQLFYWFFLSIYSNMTLLESDSNVANIAQRINDRLFFSWEEVQKIGCTDNLQECELIAFETEQNAQNFKDSGQITGFILFLSMADYRTWKINSPNEQLLNTITHNLA